jgi:hypothetical protein
MTNFYNKIFYFLVFIFSSILLEYGCNYPVSNNQDNLTEKKIDTLKIIENHKSEYIFLKFWENMPLDEYHLVKDFLINEKKIIEDDYDLFYDFNAIDDRNNVKSYRCEISFDFDSNKKLEKISLDFVLDSKCINIWIRNKKIEGFQAIPPDELEPCIEINMEEFIKMYTDKYGKPKISIDESSLFMGRSKEKTVYNFPHKNNQKVRIIVEKTSVPSYEMTMYGKKKFVESLEGNITSLQIIYSSKDNLEKLDNEIIKKEKAKKQKEKQKLKKTISDI